MIKLEFFSYKTLDIVGWPYSRNGRCIRSSSFTKLLKWLPVFPHGTLDVIRGSVPQNWKGWCIWSLFTRIARCSQCGGLYPLNSRNICRFVRDEWSMQWKACTHPEAEERAGTASWRQRECAPPLPGTCTAHTSVETWISLKVLQSSTTKVRLIKFIWFVLLLPTEAV